jgi:hypothetical protein
VRFEAYTKRIRYLLRKATIDEAEASNKARFIEYILSGEIPFLNINGERQSQTSISKYQLAKILAEQAFLTTGQLQALGDEQLTASDPMPTATATAAVVVGGEASEDANMNSDKMTEEIDINGYSYLFDMPIFSLTSESAANLRQKAEDCRSTLINLKSCKEEDLWLKDLENLKIEAAKLDPDYYRQ